MDVVVRDGCLLCAAGFLGDSVVELLPALADHLPLSPPHAPWETLNPLVCTSAKSLLFLLGTCSGQGMLLARYPAVWSRWH